ncbi:hypothetical protein SAMN04487886_103811 [Clostridium sp. DSM 8431]|uniref:HD family phosphohydrolase n=1 Tax=Clostridium sp. DSM 8431 TaxID=1761781 RepID=UPI0008E6D87E|nr:HDIG domain-containing metalloprotein [Clostridium sp. DSM 8431]SFU48419.1 hypothetical protein SAMN04487886_103811 [Clostridium sp. DSM 8431]
MRIQNIKRIKLKSKIALVIVVTFIISYILLITAVAPHKYDLRVGEIAMSDIKATRETVDETASEQKLQQAIDNVDKQFTLKSEVKKQALANIESLFNKLEDVLNANSDQAEKISELEKFEAIKLSENECKVMLSINKEKIPEIKKESLEVLEDAYKNNIENDKTAELNSVKNEAADEIEDWDLNSELTSVLKKIITSQITPNFFYDEEKTEEKIKEVQKNTERVVIKKNQIIVKEGEPVTEEQIQVLNELGLLSDESGSGFSILYFISAFFIMVILYLEHNYIYKNNKEIFYDIKKIIVINLLNVISLILARTISYGSPYLIPLACAPLLMTLLINYKISLYVSVLNAILIGTIVESDPSILVLAVLNALLGATVLRKMQQRNDILYACIKLTILIGISCFTMGILLSSNISDILLNTLFSMLGMILSGILAVGLLPFLEATFDIVTTLKLLELSNPNNQLLKRLLMEAPGTYHHSMMVANLAEMAAEEVNADSVVARIGAYYHDIGKIVRPVFFKENQMTKENPHDKINASLSTLIITSHVKDGIELAKEYKLPKVIQDIIAQHHGTTLVKYFYLTEKNNSEHPEEVREEDFRYPGPIPSSKEAGIIMLADSVEAAVRSINDPTKGKIEEMVNNIIKDKLYSGQLDNCDLTLKDLSIIRKNFLKGFNSMYHQRIEYPSEKKK